MQKQLHKNILLEGKVQKLKLVQRKKVTWSADTIDNSKMNKKSSKVCCIYHKNVNDEPCGKNKYERS